MGRVKRSTLPKKTARGKPKGQAPPRALSDKPAGAGAVKRKRDGSNPQMKSTKPDKKAKGAQVLPALATSNSFIMPNGCQIK
jgi:hypothetical protein